MLVGLVEEMTCKWERQLENVGEGRWANDMLAREGTEATEAVRSAALAGPPLPVGVIDWPGIASSLWRRHSVAWSPQLCQGLWKFAAYGDVNAAMNALPRAGETLNGAWTRQDLLYESDSEALSIDTFTITKKDSVLKTPRWGRSKSSQAKKRERSLMERARSEGPLRRAPILMSGSIDLQNSPDNAKKTAAAAAAVAAAEAAVLAGSQKGGRVSDTKSKKEDDKPNKLISLCTLAALRPLVSSRKRPASGSGGGRTPAPSSPKSLAAAAEIAAAESRVYEERQAMKLLLEQSAADASATAKQSKTPENSPGNPQPHPQPHPQPRKDSPSNWGGGGGNGSGSGGGGAGRESVAVTPAKKKRKKSSVERASPEAGRADSWAGQGRSGVPVGR
ncbi:unnamed protein product, partial [Laminaria digitata]